jgi:hypothetical protein
MPKRIRAKVSIGKNCGRKVKIESQLAKGDCIDSVLITGHGGPGSIGSGSITMDDLQDPNSEAHKFLQWLKSKMCANSNRGIRVNACMVAMGEEGQAFVGAFAKFMGTEVLAWDDWYAVVPHGKEYTGRPDGTCPQTGDTKRRYAGSWLAWFAGNGNLPKPGDGKPDNEAGKKGKGGKEDGLKVNPKGSSGLKDNLKKPNPNPPGPFPEFHGCPQT